MSTAQATAALRDTPTSTGQRRLAGDRGRQRTGVTGDEHRSFVSTRTLRKRNARGQLAEQVGVGVVDKLHREARARWHARRLRRWRAQADDARYAQLVELRQRRLGVQRVSAGG